MNFASSDHAHYPQWAPPGLPNFVGLNSPIGVAGWRVNYNILKYKASNSLSLSISNLCLAVFLLFIKEMLTYDT